VFEFCVVSDNRAAEAGGGVLAKDLAAPNLTHTSIGHNTASLSGGGIALMDSATLQLERCNVTGNSARNGGGLFVQGNARPALYGSVISRNTAAHGGGVHSLAVSPELCEAALNLLLRDNNASIAGGGCYIHLDDQIVETCEGLQYLRRRPTGNTAPHGSGVYWGFPQG